MGLFSDPGIWLILALIVTIGVVLVLLTYYVFTFRIANIWSKIICSLFVALSLLTAGFFGYSWFTDSNSITVKGCLANMVVKNDPDLVGHGV